MDFSRHRDDEEEDDEAVSYNPPIIRDSAFSKPLLPSSSTLIPGKGSATDGACGRIRNGVRSDPSSGGGQNALPVPYPATNEGRRGEGLNFPVTGSAGDPQEARYRECLRNHAASLGGHVLDGCGEFMPSSSDIMKCAACGCHRSFHRREAENDHLLYRYHNGANNSSGGVKIPLLLPPPHPSPRQIQIHSFSASPSAAMVGFGNSSGGATTTESSSEELGLPPPAAAGGFHRPFMAPSSKKRFRSKFSSQQKAKMMDFAEKIGWRIQRQDEVEMERFCADVGVSRQVFKVWMHNNKHSLRKQELQQQHQSQSQQQQPQHA